MIYYIIPRTHFIHIRLNDVISSGEDIVVRTASMSQSNGKCECCRNTIHVIHYKWQFTTILYHGLIHCVW